MSSPPPCPASTSFRREAPDADTLDQLRRLRDVGEIYRFKLFDRAGRQVLVSDDLYRAGAAPGAAAGPSIAEHQRNADVQAIVLGGNNFVERKSGAGKPDRPPWYSEAYVPVQRAGQVIGVVEVYVDQTRAEARIHAEYGRVASTVAVLMLALAGFAGWRRVRHLHERRRAEERMHTWRSTTRCAATCRRASSSAWPRTPG